MTRDGREIGKEILQEDQEKFVIREKFVIQGMFVIQKMFVIQGICATVNVNSVNQERSGM